MNTKVFSRVAGAALLVATLMIGGAGDAFAQRGQPDPDRMVNRLQTQLELSEQQVEQLRPLLEAHAAQRTEMMERAREAGTPLRENEEFMQLRERHRAQVEAVLNPDQVEKYRTMQRRFENRRDSRPGARGGQGLRGNAPGTGMERMGDRLNLTDDQKTQLRQLMTRQRAERGEMRSSFREQMAEILTDEQREQLQALQSERPGRGERGPRPRNR